MGVQKYSQRFMKMRNSDLLVIYHRVDDSSSFSLLDWNDITAITQLIVENKKQHNHLTILLHSQGGGFQCALGLMNYLREEYTGSIESVVLNIAKSSAAFLALTSCCCYMKEEALLGDFSVNQNISTNAKKTVDYATKAMEMCLYKELKKPALDVEGMKKKLESFFQLINSQDHARDILFSEAHDKFSVKNFNTFGQGDWHIGTVHNEILLKMEESKGINKIFGYNGSYVYM